MSEAERTLVDKSESSSFEDLASAAAHEIEEAKLAETAAAEKERSAETKTDEWQDVLGSGALLKKVSIKYLFLFFCVPSFFNTF